jgi:hypothetical protein
MSVGLQEGLCVARSSCAVVRAHQTLVCTAAEVGALSRSLKPSSHVAALGLTQPLTEMKGVESGRRGGLTPTPPSVSPLSGQCGILNISQPYRPPRPEMGIAVLFYM